MSKEFKSQSLESGTQLRSKERVYEIVKVLGSGSFGITYLATSKFFVGNISTTIKFAIKEHFISASCFRGEDGATVQTVPSAMINVRDSRTDFITEANRLKKLCLKSRNIVSVNETFEANGTAYYVMEFLDGGTPSKCREEEAISIVKQIGNALDEIHKERVLHLDVKPDNIVMKKDHTGETYPVLIDFGISKHFDSKGRPTTKLNAKGASPGYAPQEQYAEITEFSPKYDIYALGAVLFYLTTGKNPPSAFNISPNQQELKKELDGQCSPMVSDAILNAMKPNRFERTGSVEDFLKELGQEEANESSYDESKNNKTTPFLNNKKEKQSVFSILRNLFGIKSRKFEINEHRSLLNDSIINRGASILHSTMIGVYKGMVTEIGIEQWIELSEEEKSRFTPLYIYFNLDGTLNVEGRTIGLALNEQVIHRAEDVYKALADYSKSLNPSEISGYELGSCRMPNLEESHLMEKHEESINVTLKEWGFAPFCSSFWIEEKGKLFRNNHDGLDIGLRIIVNYWATRIIFELKRTDGDSIVDSIPTRKIIKRLEVKYRQQYSIIRGKKLILTPEGNNEVWTVYAKKDDSKPQGYYLTTEVEKWEMKHSKSSPFDIIPEDVENCLKKNGLLDLDRWGPSQRDISTVDIKNFEVAITIEYMDGSQSYFHDMGPRLRTSELLLIAKDILNQESIRKEAFKFELNRMRNRHDLIMSSQNNQILDTSILAIKNNTLYEIYPKRWLEMSAKEKLSYYVCSVCFSEQPNNDDMQSVQILPLLKYATKNSYLSLIRNVEQEIGSKCEALRKEIYDNKMSFILELPLKFQLDQLYKIITQVNFTLEFWNADGMVTFNLPYMKLDINQHTREICFPENNKNDFVRLVSYITFGGDFGVPYERLD